MKTYNFYQLNYNILTFDEKLILSNQTQEEVDTFFIGKEQSLYLLEFAGVKEQPVFYFMPKGVVTPQKYLTNLIRLCNSEIEHWELMLQTYDKAKENLEMKINELNILKYLYRKECNS